MRQEKMLQKRLTLNAKPGTLNQDRLDFQLSCKTRWINGLQAIKMLHLRGLET